jgi:hypothetical protein
MNMQEEQLQKLRNFTMKANVFHCVDLKAVMSKNEELKKAIDDQRLENAKLKEFH